MKISKYYPYKSSLERRYAAWLEVRKLAGEILGWSYEPKVFTLARRMVYTPDFEVVTLSEQFQYVEIKGWHKNLYVSRDKWKMAAEKFPMHRWFWATWNGGKGCWKHEEYKPLTERRLYP